MGVLRMYGGADDEKKVEQFFTYYGEQCFEVPEGPIE